ncbi:MAG: hypothetical protein SFW36_17220 [Leptolyngbyaceae cyanobacterium bins.59]|nr:hypothetical protein [Leptolyngbyaceae cyanobacterium bins.59]
MGFDSRSENAHLESSKSSWRIAAIFYGALFLTTLLLAYTGHLPTQLAAIPYYDKAGHIILYCLASYIGHQFLRHRHFNLGEWHLPLWPLIFGVLTIVEELLQSLSPNRSLDWIDLVASLAGVCLGYALAERGKGKSR